MPPEQKQKLKDKFGNIEKAIDQGAAYRVLRSVFPMSKSVTPLKVNT
jgi:hypothetical protein